MTPRAWAAAGDLLEDAGVAARLAAALPGYLRECRTPEDAALALRRRLLTRGDAWLALVREAVLGHARSPYRRLLRRAGCEMGDLERMVRRDGLEATLGQLFRAGVYLTIEEFKGRQPVVRGAERFLVSPGDLRNPRGVAHAFVRSGGSRGAGTPVPVDLAFQREQADNLCLHFQARGGTGWHKAHWMVPGGGAVIMLLTHAGFGRRPEAWFSQLDPGAATMPARYRWSARLVCATSRLAGRPLPPPRHVPVDDPRPIIDWMAGLLRAGEVPLLQTFTSSAVRLCRAAADAGIDLAGAQLSLGGEPVTAATAAAVRAAGATGVGNYGSVETGSAMSLGCLSPAEPDDSHVAHDLHAIIQPGDGGAPAGLPPRALLVTSLRPRAPRVLLNVSMGDEAVLERRACGCPLAAHGWPTHAHTIRSFEKLTAGGMTFLDVDAIRVLEELLPARFGGAPGHYQLVEEEGADATPRLVLAVHPAVGSVDEAGLVETFLQAIGRGEDAKRVMAQAWRRNGVLRVERRPLWTTGTGKVLHLYRRAP